MCKKMTFITCIEDSAGNTIDFYRWSYKRASTCEKAIRKLYRPSTSFPNFMKHDLERGKQISCYATPDGYHKEKNPVWSIQTNDLLELF